MPTIAPRSKLKIAQGVFESRGQIGENMWTAEARLRFSYTARQFRESRWKRKRPGRAGSQGVSITYDASHREWLGRKSSHDVWRHRG
jgi:hypothetical protein